MPYIKVCGISDTHNLHDRLVIPPCDLLIHAGDATNQGTRQELEKFEAWLLKQPAKVIVYVPGNHDLDCQNKNWRPKAPIHCLVDQSLEVFGLKIYGSPWQPEFCNWAYNLPRNQHGLRNKWRAIPDDTNILITHGPAFGMLDNGKGCELLAARLLNLPDLKLHVFGHIHEGAGEIIHRYHSVNAVMAFLRVIRDPVEIDLEVP